MTLLWRGTGSLLVACVAAAGTATHAQNYPHKPIRMIVGPGSDFVVRLVGRRLTEVWGQQIVVETRPGGGGVIAAELVSKATPDGYTLLNTTGSYTINAGLYKNLPYDLVRDFTPVSLFIRLPLVLSVHPAVPAQSVQELVKLARARPGQLNCASSGNGTSAHLACEMLRSTGKIEIVHVPYKGLPAATTDLLGGQVQMAFIITNEALPHVKSGRLRALGVSGPKRAAAAPDIPTIAESGIPEYSYETWNGVHAPAGTPKAIIARLNAEIVKAVRFKEINERFVNMGMEPAGNTPDEFAAFVREDLARTAKVIKASGMRVE